MVSIVDNFLDKADSRRIRVYLTQPDRADIPFPWTYTPNIDYSEEYREAAGIGPKELDTFQFEHWFWAKDKCISEQMGMIIPILSKINPLAMYRVKANLVPRTADIIENSLHVDIGDFNDSLEKLKQWTTSIYYVNTNNGYTKFETGEIVESVENRMVTFPSNIRHTGSSCSDEKIRVVINFNYFSR